MSRAWRMGAVRPFWLHEGWPDPGQRPVGRAEATALARRCWQTSPAVVRSILEHFTLSIGPYSRSDRTDQAIEALARLLQTGRLQLQAPRVRGELGIRPRRPEAPSRSKPAPRPSETSDHWFEVRVVDEIGAPVAGLALSLDEMRTHAIVTDGDGRCRVHGVKGTHATVTLDDTAGVKEALRPRWDLVRLQPWVEDGPDVTTLPVRGDRLPAVPVLSETPHTIVLQPWVVRIRLMGMAFDANK